MTPVDLADAAARALSLHFPGEVRLRVAWVAPTTTSHVFRVQVDEPRAGLPGTLIVKAANPEAPGDGPEMLFNEWAALQFLSENAEPPLAARLHAGDAAAALVVMEDLGTGKDSPAQIVEGRDPDRAEEALVAYAGTLGRLHGSTAGKADRFREIRSTLPRPPRARPLYHDPWSDAGPRSEEEIRAAIAEYADVFATLGLRPAAGFDDEIRIVTESIERHEGPFRVLCQGDQNSLQHPIRGPDGLRLIDFGVAGFRHALIEGMPHRLTWGCIRRVPRRLFAPLEEAYRIELAKGCAEARRPDTFRCAMAEAGGRWSVFHVIWRVPDALKGDRPRGGASLRQQVLAWLGAFAELSEELGQLPALGRSAAAMQARLRELWPPETHRIPLFPAFDREGGRG